MNMHNDFIKLIELGIMPLDTFLERLEAFNTALAKCQKEIKAVSKDKSTAHFSHATYEVIRDATKDNLGDNGLSITHHPTGSNEDMHLITVLAHSKGYERVYVTPMFIKSHEESRLCEQQEVGTSITYYKRYVYCSILGIPTLEPDIDDKKPNTIGSVNKKSITPKDPYKPVTENQANFFNKMAIGKTKTKNLILKQYNITHINELKMGDFNDVLEMLNASSE